jgi:hypothetical protein
MESRVTDRFFKKFSLRPENLLKWDGFSSNRISFKNKCKKRVKWAGLKAISLFFYCLPHPVNGIGCQNRHPEFSFSIVDELSHDLSLIRSGQFERMVHADIFAV